MLLAERRKQATPDLKVAEKRPVALETEIDNLSSQPSAPEASHGGYRPP